MSRWSVLGRRQRSRAYWILPVVFVVAAVASYLAARAHNPGPASQAGSQEAAPGHIHGFGVNPSDNALFIATHTGLFRQGGQDEAPVRVGDSHQDTMGFAVVGADHFVGSGHPDLRTDLPPLLGLIESRDAGRTWQPIALLGKADFHTLRVHGKVVVGYDSTRIRVMVSRDGGRTWRANRVQEPLVDVVSDSAARVLFASSASKLLGSKDGGRSWSTINEAPGLLAWPRARRLYLLPADGRLWRSPDEGRRWKHVGQVGGRPAAFLVDGKRMYAALHDGTVKRSDDGGRTWRSVAWPAG